MADTRTRREKLLAMANQSVSVPERDIARAKLAAMEPARPVMGPVATAVARSLAESMADLERGVREMQESMGRAMKSAAEASSAFDAFSPRNPIDYQSVSWPSMGRTQQPTPGEYQWFRDYVQRKQGGGQ